MKTLILFLAFSVSLFADQELIRSVRKHVDKERIHVKVDIWASKGDYILTNVQWSSHKNLKRIYIKNLDLKIDINNDTWEGWIYPLGKHYTTSRQEAIVYLYNKYVEKRPKVINDRERLLNN